MLLAKKHFLKDHQGGGKENTQTDKVRNQGLRHFFQFIGSFFFHGLALRIRSLVMV